jgi:phage gpG-like protein
VANERSEILGEAQVRTGILALGPKLSQIVMRRMHVVAIGVQGHVVRNKLSGQVLRNRTGTLRRSINQKVVASNEGVFGTVGTNVIYARPHELGFKGTVTVRDHVRHAKGGRASVVKTHRRKVELPVRSFLRSSLEDKRDWINQQFKSMLEELASS